ncbi:MAG: KpsF/GutQ family sugar-phosphate isomerase [Gemmatimonadaceae bacterium]|nr:KpsF/GutQ family sugar-phosphate isomerase [Gemmatimonadaceae bacterium]MDQ3243262.1 KpsF/GutQ family sugar-phosphate isomerase [Gemmatimonadota bacterium]
MKTAEIIDRGRRVIRMEREALEESERRLGESFARAVTILARSKGRAIVSGVGKSGLIGRKIAATLTSTGTPATFLHPSESLHGDLGIVGATDVAILISKSGESNELVSLLEHLKRLGVCTIAITGDRGSTLARHTDVWLDAWVNEEACVHDLAPTTSTTVALALGDALAVALLEEKGFNADDFARLHPGGALGRRLLTQVRDVMVTGALAPVLTAEATMREAVVHLAERRGIAVICDEHQRVAGVVTSGDLTRLMEHEDNVMPIPVDRVMTRSPRIARDDELGSAVVYRMEQHGIISMPVVDADDRMIGVIHLHDLMRAGVV